MAAIRNTGRHDWPADLQNGVLTRSQALSAGITDQVIATNLKRGRWQRLHPGVYATFSGVPSADCLLWAAVLRAGPAAVLSHPNVATIHDAGEHDGRPFLVMELLAGRDFGQVLLARGGLPVADVLAYGAQIAAGLQHAHEHGLVHRDIKPENLMLLPDGAVKICDFGLVAQRDANLTRYTDPHAVMGSPPYLSPEQAQGREVTAQSDLYALGCVLYALLAEGPPFSSGNVIGYAYAHVHEMPERIERRRPEVPSGLDISPDSLDALMEPGKPWWDPESDRSVDPATDRVVVDGKHVGAGSRVLLRPGLRRSDAQDLFLRDQAALVEAVLHDVDGGVHLAVTVEGDPGADIRREQGRFLYFQPDEVTPLEDA